MNTRKPRFLIGAFFSLVFVAALALAQQFVPITPTTTVPAATGTVINNLIVAVDPVIGNACGTYNVAYQNWVNGDELECVNGTIQASNRQLWTGSASADAATQVTLSAGAGTYTLVGTYLTSPVCQATDQTAAAAVKASATTTVVTLAGTGTDVISLSCVKRT
jgi:hypothetical protein